MPDDVARDFWPIEVLSRQLEEGSVHAFPWLLEPLLWQKIPQNTLGQTLIHKAFFYANLYA